MTLANYCLRGDLSEEMQVSDPNEDARLDRAITDASRVIDTFTRQEPGTFAPRTLTKVFDIYESGYTYFAGNTTWQASGVSPVRAIAPRSYRDPGQTLCVPPLLSITSLATDNDGDGVYETVWSSPTDYLLSPRNAEVKRQIDINQHTGRFGLPQGQATVQIIGSWGITEDGLTPEPIRRACLQLAMIYYRKPTPGGGSSSNLGGAAVHIGYSDVDVAAILWEISGRYREQWLGA